MKSILNIGFGFILIVSQGCSGGHKEPEQKQNAPGVLISPSPKDAEVIQMADTRVVSYMGGTLCSFTKIATDAPIQGERCGDRFTIKYDSTTKNLNIYGQGSAKMLEWNLTFVKKRSKHTSIYLDGNSTLYGEPEEKNIKHYYFVTDSIKEKGRLVMEVDSDRTPDKTIDVKKQMSGLYKYQFDYLMQYENELDNAERKRSPKEIEIIGEKGDSIISALKRKDFKALSQFVHPLKGLRFSPYPDNEGSAPTFLKEDVAELWKNAKVYVWGFTDGGDDSIKANFKSYYKMFVYDVDYALAKTKSCNKVIHRPNCLYLLDDYYPLNDNMDYYIPGKSESDYSTLHLIFQELDGNWFLVHISHDSWCI